MGAILAKFKKSKTSTEILESLEEKIQEIESYSQNTQQQKKRFVGNFLACSIGVYVIAFVAFYFVYFPTNWKERFIYFVPMLGFPVLVFFLRRLFTWHFERKLNKNSKKLIALRAEKKKILEQVMDKETYKVAANLLNRFGDSSTVNRYGITGTPRSRTSLNTIESHPLRSLDSSVNVTHSATQMTPASSSLQIGSRLTSPLSATNLSRPQIQLNPNYNKSILTNQSRLLRSPASTNAPPVGSSMELRRRNTPFPIVNQENKGVFERIVDILVGDGPQDRFAMICKKCFAHNGMALKEEFDYATFRCAFCNEMNPSRKARPMGPRLPVQEPISLPANAGDSSESSSTSNESDTEVQHVPSIETLDSTPRDRSETDDFEMNTAGTDRAVKSSRSESSLECAHSTETNEKHKEPNNEEQEDLLKKIREEVNDLGTEFLESDELNAKLHQLAL